MEQMVADGSTRQRSAEFNSALDTVSPASSDREKLAAFLSVQSLEVTARQYEKFPILARRMRAGSRVYIACIGPEDAPGQIRAAARLAELGFTPVPHFPARLIEGAGRLEDLVSRFVGEAGITDALLVGGGAGKPLGEFSSVMDMLETGIFDRFGITSLGFAGHPEGNADIERAAGEAALVEALRLKQAFAGRTGARTRLVTQFVFAARPVIDWAGMLADENIDLPVHVGLPGPATVKTLVKYALTCGVGPSARIIQKQALNITKLMRVSMPDDTLAGLAEAAASGRGRGIAQAHFFPFGGLEKLFDWLDSLGL